MPVEGFQLPVTVREARYAGGSVLTYAILPDGEEAVATSEGRLSDALTPGSTAYLYWNPRRPRSLGDVPWRVNTLQAHERRTRALMTAPMAAFGVLLVALPLIYVLCTSLVTGGKFQFGMPLTLANYKALLREDYLKVFANSLQLAFFTTVISPAGGLSLRLLHGARPLKWKALLMMLVIIPFWTSAHLRLEDPPAGQRPGQRRAPPLGADSEEHQVPRLPRLGAAGDGLLPDFLYDPAVPQRGG